MYNMYNADSALMNDSVARPVNYDKQEMNGKRTTLQAKPRFSHFMVHKTAKNNRCGGGNQPQCLNVGWLYLLFEFKGIFKTTYRIWQPKQVQLWHTSTNQRPPGFTDSQSAVEGAGSRAVARVCPCALYQTSANQTSSVNFSASSYAAARPEVPPTDFCHWSGGRSVTSRSFCEVLLILSLVWSRQGP